MLMGANTKIPAPDSPAATSQIQTFGQSFSLYRTASLGVLLGAGTAALDSGIGPAFHFSRAISPWRRKRPRASAPAGRG